MTNARDLTGQLAELLRREHAAMAEFLVALAEFDRKTALDGSRLHVLWYYLHRELGLSKGAATFRKTAAELVERYPEVVEPLRDGRLCISSVVELGKVITPENRAEVLPRFFHRSKQEAKAVAREINPVEAPPRRDVVTARRDVSRLGAPCLRRGAARRRPGVDHGQSSVHLDEPRVRRITSKTGVSRRERRPPCCPGPRDRSSR